MYVRCGNLVTPRFIRACLLGVLFALFPWQAAAADAVVSGRELKAALILRLVDFVEWPVEDANFQLCVIGDEPLADVLRKLAASTRSRVQIQPRKSLKNTEGCRLLVLGTYDEQLVRAYLALHRGEPVLTVGDRNEFLQEGGIIGLRIEGGRVAIDLNLKAATASRLRVSSRLARLARIVEPNGGPW